MLIKCKYRSIIHWYLTIQAKVFVLLSSQTLMPSEGHHTSSLKWVPCHDPYLKTSKKYIPLWLCASGSCINARVCYRLRQTYKPGMPKVTVFLQAQILLLYYIILKFFSSIIRDDLFVFFGELVKFEVPRQSIRSVQFWQSICLHIWLLSWFVLFFFCALHHIYISKFKAWCVLWVFENGGNCARIQSGKMLRVGFLGFRIWESLTPVWVFIERENEWSKEAWVILVVSVFIAWRSICCALALTRTSKSSPPDKRFARRSTPFLLLLVNMKLVLEAWMLDNLHSSRIPRSMGNFRGRKQQHVSRCTSKPERSEWGVNKFLYPVSKLKDASKLPRGVVVS